MKIIEAFWEKRNLGVTCQEVIIESYDIDINACLTSLRAQYQVVKTPIERPELIFRLQDLGFKFIEVQFLSSHNLNIPPLNPVLERLKKSITFSVANGASLENIEKKILEGVFKTDRVAIDPNFGLQKSSKRYVGWLHDTLEQGGHIYELRYKHIPVGFFLLKTNKTICEGVIGGTFPDPKIIGLGTLLNYFEIIVSQDLGCQKLHINFSSNNPSILKINNYLNYETVPVFNVFVRHSCA